MGVFPVQWNFYAFVNSLSSVTSILSNLILIIDYEKKQDVHCIHHVSCWSVTKLM